MKQENEKQKQGRLNFVQNLRDISLVGAPLLFLISEIIHPESQTVTADELSSVTSYHTQWYIAHMAALLAIIMIPSAIQGLIKLLENRYYTLSHIGAGFISLGTVALSGLLAFDFITWTMAENNSRAVMIDLYDHITGSPSFSLPFLTIGPLLLVAGMLFLALLLLISKAVNRWQAICFGIGIFLYGFAGPVFAVSNGVYLVISGAVLMLAGLGSIGLMDLLHPRYDNDNAH